MQDNPFADLIPGSQPQLRQILPPRPKMATPQTPEQRAYTVASTGKISRELAQPVLSPGQKAVDETFAKDHYLPYVAGGGFSDVGKQLNQLKTTTQMLQSGKNLTGPVLGRLPDFVTAFTNPDAITAREQVEEPVQRSLRMILGAQFTENEGKRLIERAYNPSLPETENRKRVARIRIQLGQAAKAKESAVRYFEKNGTLKGWKGRLWGLSDFDPQSNRGIQPQQPRKPQGGIQFLGFE